MPPPKLKIHKSSGSGKLKSIPKPQPSTSQTNPEQREAQEKFEIELAWCIQRLEETLNSGKLNQNQKQCKNINFYRFSLNFIIFFFYINRQWRGQKSDNSSVLITTCNQKTSIDETNFRWLSRKNGWWWEIFLN